MPEDVDALLMLAKWTRTQLTLLSPAPSYFHRVAPYLQYARELGHFCPPGLEDPNYVLMGGHSIPESLPPLLRASLSCCFRLFSEPSTVHRPPAERTASPTRWPHSSGFPGWGGGGEPLWDAKHQTSQAWGFRPRRH